jgi:hypothetical protein
MVAQATRTGLHTKQCKLRIPPLLYVALTSATHCGQLLRRRDNDNEGDIEGSEARSSAVWIA